MYRTIKKMLFAFALLMVIAATGALQGGAVAYAAAEKPETPLVPGLTWNEAGQAVRIIQLNIQGDTLVLAGEAFQAKEVFANGVPDRVSEFYSNVELYKAGWVSDNVFEDADGTHLVFYHEAGYYLAIDYLHCGDQAGSTCVTVWKSAHKDTANFIAGTNQQSASIDPAAVFGKKTPADGSTGLNPSSIYLSWESYPGTQKYSYCIKEGADCPKDDPNWTGTNLNTSITINNLNPNKAYHWNVKAITCLSCNPKVYILADGGDWWDFQTTTTTVKISGNAGVSYATLGWVDGVSKTTTADANGDYSIFVSYNWTGKVTPVRSGYSFIPAFRSYTNLTTNQTGQNYAAITAVTISGNVGVSGVTLSYTDGIAKSVSSDSNGNYALTVTYNWSGTVVPSKLGYVFAPLSRTYTNVLSNIPAQNYIPTFVTYTISGDAGIGGATLKYVVGGVTKTVTSTASGSYLIKVPSGWSGKITPSKTGVSSFTPAYRTYTNVNANFANQDYRANILAKFTSVGSQDGFILEKSETSGLGGAIYPTEQNLLVGDDAVDRQTRSILSFNTSSLPDSAVILKIRVKLTNQKIVGTNPLTTHGPFYFDIRSQFFGTWTGLESVDFNAAPSLAKAGWLGVTPAGKVYTGSIGTAGFTHVNKIGVTQLRMYFNLGDNDNNVANYIAFYSGDATTIAYRPVLEITYYVP